MVLLIFSIEIAHSSSRPIVNISVSVLLSEDSLWTEAEVRQRLGVANDIFMRSCNIHIVVANLRTVKLNSVTQNGPFEIPSRNELEANLKAVGSSRPVIFYMKRFYKSSDDKMGLTGQTLSIGDETHAGNLKFDEFLDPSSPSVKPFHGVVFLTDHFSSSYKPKMLEEITSGPGALEAHELGHALLNSSEHSESPGNLMSKGGLVAKLSFTPRQCARMRSYYEREKNLFGALAKFYPKLMIKHFGSVQKYLEKMRHEQDPPNRPLSSDEQQGIQH